MSLYKEWTNMVVEYVKNNGEAAFWEEYGAVQKSIYSRILKAHKTNVKGIVKDLAKEYAVSNTFFVGFLDSLNTSLTEPVDFENLEENSEIDVNIDLEKLYSNMLQAGTEYLYELPQWEAALSSEKRKNIRSRYKGMIPRKVSTKIGRNDPCPCGSGLKYKNCCGK